MDISDATQATYEIESVRPEDAGVYRLRAQGIGERGEPVPVTASVEVVVKPASAPLIQFFPSSITARAASDTTVQVRCVGSYPRTYQWYRNGEAIAGATGSELELKNLHPRVIGAYSVSITNPYGSVVSSPAPLILTHADPPKIPLGFPSHQTIVQGENLNFAPLNGLVNREGQWYSIIESDLPIISYQWFKNGEPIPGANMLNLALRDIRMADAGRYSVVITNFIGSSTSREATVVVTPSTIPQSRIANLAVRATAGEGDRRLVVGFVIAGAASKRMLVRAAGPALAGFGVAGAISDPRLAVLDGRGVALVSNDNWSSANNAMAVQEMTQRVGGFAFSPGSGDAAVLQELPAGNYTVEVSRSATSQSGGVALVEAYDTDETTDGARLINIAARVYVGEGAEIAIPGVVLQGRHSSAAKMLLVRAVGPGLADFGVGGTLPNPRIDIYREDRHLVSNDDWGQNSLPWRIAQIAKEVGAFPLREGSRDAALLVKLTSAAYTMRVSNVGDGSGVALVEIYEVPN